MPPELLTTGEHFALEVRGDSMIEAGILDGDIALLKRSEAADTGDIVVALIDDEEATLKRFRRRGASIALEPANTAYEVRILPPNRVRIQGKLVGLFRRYWGPAAALLVGIEIFRPWRCVGGWRGIAGLDFGRRRRRRPRTIEIRRPRGIDHKA